MAFVGVIRGQALVGTGGVMILEEAARTVESERASGRRSAGATGAVESAGTEGCFTAGATGDVRVG